VEYRVKIFDERFSGSSTRLIDTENFVTVNLGESDGEGRSGFKPREIEVSLATDEDLSVLTDAAEDDIRVELDRQDTGQTVYKGYIAPNQYSDRPLFERDVDVVRLTGSEGLNLLEKDDVSSLSISDFLSVPVFEAVTEILSTLYPSPLGLQFGVHWYAADKDFNQASFPLKERTSPDALRQSRPDGDFRSLGQALKDILAPFGLTIQQTVRPHDPSTSDPSNSSDELIWWISQWGAYSNDGDIDVWEVPPDASTTTKRSENVLVDLGVIGQDSTIQPDHERTFERQRSDVTVTYNHPRVENFIIEPGLEGVRWDLIGGNVAANSIIGHENAPPSPSPTSGDSVVGRVAQNPGEVGFGIGYDGELVPAEPDSALKFQMSYALTRNDSTSPLVEISIGDTYFEVDRVQLRGSAPENETRLNVEPLPVPIPEGARLPIQNQQSPTVEAEGAHVAFFTLEERAEEGDTLLEGDLSGNVGTNDYLVFVRPVSAQVGVLAAAFRPFSAQGSWGTVTFYMPMQTPSGNKIVPNDFSVRVGLTDSRPSIADDDELEELYFDDVILEPVRNGEGFSETEAVAQDGTVGESEELSIRIGSGPSQSVVSRVTQRFLWGIGPAPSPSFPLEELLARERLRYFRGQNKRLTVRPVRDDPLLGHELVKLNGDTFRVVSTETTRTEGEYAVTLLEHTDYGTS
jgi:hypothetical protein